MYVCMHVYCITFRVHVCILFVIHIAFLMSVIFPNCEFIFVDFAKLLTYYFNFNSNNNFSTKLTVNVFLV